ncbi:MAG: toll/interleukin-1 receptor domain-containing protein [Gammaproteobacteria bacterium]|nr:toll/interleukin-1 receptor domain-containing protein [Gammaproteobacteria bacterium]
MIRAFLSHSSKDKDRYVRIVANCLGKENVIYDEYSFEEGERTISEILLGLDKSALFVFFVSNHSLDSPHVSKELDEAYGKLNSSDLRKIYPILIDSSITHDDSRIKSWLKDDYNIRLISRPTIAARRIRGKLREISWDNHPEVKRRQNLFVGRNDKLEEFEERIDDFYASKPKCVIVSGLPAIGRRTFVKNALLKSNITKSSYEYPSIYLGRNDSVEDFIVKLNDLGYADATDDIVSLIDKSLNDKIYIAANLVKAAQDSKDIILVLDDGCIVNYKREVAGWFDRIINDHHLSNQAVIACASKYKVSYSDRKNKDSYLFINLPELSVSERRRLFSKLLEIHNIIMDAHDFDMFSEQFYGFPDQIIFCIELIERHGLDKAKKDVYQLTAYNTDRASVLLRNYDENEGYLQFIRLLAQFEFISIDFIFDIVEEAKYAPVLEMLMAENICEFIGSEAIYIRLNDVVRDFIKRNQFEIKEEYKIRIKKHVKTFIEEDKWLDRDSSDYLFSVKEALEEGVNINYSKIIPSHMLRCMKDLYQKRKGYERIIELADILLDRASNLDADFVSDVRYYLCLSLARLKNDRLLREVQNIQGDEHNFLLGYYYRLKGRHRDAISRLEPILNKQYVGARAKRELVQVLIQIEEYDSALIYARQNYSENRGNIHHVHAYFNCLIYSNDYFQHKDTLRMLYEELESSGSDVGRQMAMTSKALYLARCCSDYRGAINVINDAISTYHDIHYPYLMKFELAVKGGDILCMKEAMTELEKLHKSHAISERTFTKQKAYLMGYEGNLEGGEKVLLSGLTDYPLDTKDKILRSFQDHFRKVKNI